MLRKIINFTIIKVAGYFKYMASHAPCHYDKSCELYWDVPMLIYYLTPVKVDGYFNWDNVRRKIFNFTTTKADTYFKYMASHAHQCSKDFLFRLFSSFCLRSGTEAYWGEAKRYPFWPRLLPETIEFLLCLSSK